MLLRWQSCRDNDAVSRKDAPTRKVWFCSGKFVYRFNMLKHSRWSFKDDSTFCPCTRSKMKILFSFSPFLNRCDFQVISNIMWGIWGLTNQHLLRVDKSLLYDITKKGSQWVARRHKRLEYKVMIRLKIAGLNFASWSPDNFICVVKQYRIEQLSDLRQEIFPMNNIFFNAIRQAATACVWERESFSSFDSCFVLFLNSTQM